MAERTRIPRRAWALAFAVAALTALAPSARAEGTYDASKARDVQDAIAQQDGEIQRSGVKAVVNRLESATMRSGDPLTLYLLARAYAKAGKTRDAIDTYAEVVKKDAAFPFAWRDRGVLRYQWAQDRRRTAADPRTPPPAAAAATAEADRALHDAEADFRQAVAVWPDYVEALQPLGVLLAGEANRPKEAIPFLRRLVEVDPGRENARYQLAQAYGRAGQLDDGLRVIDPLLASAPNDPVLRELRAFLLAEKGDSKAAVAIYKQLAVESPTTPRPLEGALRAIKKNANGFEASDVVWFLERLRRLAATEEDRRKITTEIERLSAAGTAPTAGAAPTPAELAARLVAAPAAERAKLLETLARAQGFPVDPKLALALAEVLADPKSDAETRKRALVVFEKFSPPGEVSLGALFGAAVYGSLADPDAGVRAKAAEVLGSFDSAAVVPYHLHAVAVNPDPAFAEAGVAARVSIYRLAKARPPESEDDAESQRKAFLAWWASPAAAAVKLRAVEDQKLAQDERPELGLFRLAFLEKEPDVWIAAVRALAEVTARRNPRKPPPPERDAWLKAFPTFSDADLQASGRDAVRGALATWWEKRPNL